MSTNKYCRQSITTLSNITKYGNSDTTNCKRTSNVEEFLKTGPFAKGFDRLQFACELVYYIYSLCCVYISENSDV